MISDSVELCETEVCFLHMQLTTTNVLLPKIHETLPEVDFVSLRSPAKSESWNRPTLQCCAVFSTWQYCLNSHVLWMQEIKRAWRRSQAPVHFVTALARLFTDQRMSSLPIRAKYEHFKTFCEQTSDTSQLIWVLLSWSGDHPSKDLRLCITARSFCLPVRNISQRIFEHVPPCRRTTLLFSCEAFPTLVIFQLLQQKLVIRTFFCVHRWWFRSACIHVECIPNIRGREMKLVPQDQHSSSISSTRNVGECRTGKHIFWIVAVVNLVRRRNLAEVPLMVWSKGGLECKWEVRKCSMMAESPEKVCCVPCCAKREKKCFAKHNTPLWLEPWGPWATCTCYACVRRWQDKLWNTARGKITCAGNWHCERVWCPVYTGATRCFFPASSLFSMNKQAFPIRHFFPFKFHQSFLELSFPQGSSKWVVRTNFS